jgi:hypothetical protein
MRIQTLWKDDEHPRTTTWINMATGELVVVEGIKCPEGCREPDREEADKIIRNCYVPGGDNMGWKPFKPR